VSVVTLPGRYAPDTPPLVLPKAGVFAEAQGRLVGRRIAALAGAAVATPEFDAVGFCYLEVGGGRAVRAEGSFFALPHPQMRKHTPDAEQFRDKLAWVAQHLQPPT
jgi:sulfide:quinone oxidoreductase